jgi:hypothetical protein
VPLLCSGCGFKVERADQVEGGFAERHAFDAGPQVDHVSLLAAARIEAMEDVLVQVHTERATAAITAVDRTRAAALRAAAA